MKSIVLAYVSEAISYPQKFQTLSGGPCPQIHLAVASVFFFYVCLLGMTQLTRTTLIALGGLMSPPKDTKVNLLLNFWGRAECTQKRNKSLLQVGLEPCLDLSIRSPVL